MKKDNSGREKTTFTAREVAVLLEEIRSQQKAIFEGQDFIKSKIETLEINQAKIWEKLTQIDLRLIKVEKKVEEIDLRLTNIEKDIGIIKADLKVFDKRLVHLEEATPK